MKYLKTIRKHVKEISNTLILIEDAEETSAPKDYICERYDLLLRQTEALTLCARNSLPIEYSRQITGEYELTESCIELSENEYPDTLILTIPRLLPHRIKETQKSKEYFYAAYIPAIQKLLSGKKRYNEKVVIWYQHLHSQYKEMRDYDNIETKYITDIITPYLIEDDNPNFCSIFQSGKKSDEAKTRILILPEHAFPEVFQKEQGKR